MPYYKVTLDDTIIDALTELDCCKYSPRSRMVLRCGADDNPEGIISTRTGLYYHVDGWAEFPEAVTGSGGTVTLIEIYEDAYESIVAALDAGSQYDDPEDDDPDTGGEAETPLTRAELTAKVLTLEEELQAAKILLGVSE